MTPRLGKKPATTDARDLRLARYVAPSLTPPPTDTGNVRRLTDWGMLGNDRYGDCVFAGAAHETMLWTLEGAGRPAAFDDRAVLSDYAAVTGFDPSTGAHDDGTYVRDALRYRRNTGIIDARSSQRHRIHAYAALEPGNRDHVRMAVHLLDAVGIGFEFPDYAMDQFNRGRAWAVLPGRVNIEGGHYVPALGYDRHYLYVVTWGKVQKMSWAFFGRFADEAWGILSAELLAAGKSPDGLDLPALDADLKALSYGTG
jgi:hypothetical protein